jgi:microcystin-dependent protein
MSDPFIGEIRMFGGNFAPRGWATCDGQLLSIAQNTALFSILGTTYGGNGQTTFALPDLRGRRPIHQGQGPGLSPYTLGEMAGAENTTLTISNMPAHNHLVNASNTTGTQVNPGGNVLAPGVDSVSGACADFILPASINTTMAPNMITPAGNNVPFSVLDPFLCVNFIIALEGIYPSRN